MLARFVIFGVGIVGIVLVEMELEVDGAALLAETTFLRKLNIALNDGVV